jgi:hypothetical protein
VSYLTVEGENDHLYERLSGFRTSTWKFCATAELRVSEIATPTHRAALNLVREFVGVSAAVFAWPVCAGTPALLAAFGTIGASGLAQYAYVFPAFPALLGFSVWLIWRSGYLRKNLAPFWLALTGAIFAIVTTWLSLVGISPSILWCWPYIGIAGLVGASLWSFVLGRRPGECFNEMIREALLRQKRGSVAHRMSSGALKILVVLATLYGLYLSVNVYVPA